MYYDPFFDLNRDGEIDATEWAFMESITNPQTESVDEEEELEDELEMSGLDYDELANMDEDSRREVLEDAGLDPDEYDEF